MPSFSASGDSCTSMEVLSGLLLSSESADPSGSPLRSGWTRNWALFSRKSFDGLVSLASANHVVVRGLEALRCHALEARDGERAAWAADALANERARIAHAIPYLRDICHAFVRAGHPIIVIKSLDHWPDLGSDLDLYTNAPPPEVLRLMQTQFEARTEARSWGDRLAGKWNFLIPGLPESVEIHVGRLGQTGEQVRFAAALPGRARSMAIGQNTFLVPANSDRLMISTLQRMYRHFYFRLCDIVDSASLIDSGMLDFGELCREARAAGIWEGVATYLQIVSDYVGRFRGRGLALPGFVTASARFGGEQVYYARQFLRIPILPQSAGLYGSQLGGLLRKREIRSSARLGLLLWLATAAAVGQRITGSDKGIW